MRTCTTRSNAGRFLAGPVCPKPVTDAVKRLDDDDLVAGTVDRARLALIGLPQVVRAAQWAGAAGSVAVGGDTPAAALVRSGAVVVGVLRHPS